MAVKMASNSEDSLCRSDAVSVFVIPDPMSSSSRYWVSAASFWIVPILLAKSGRETRDLLLCSLRRSKWRIGATVDREHQLRSRVEEKRRSGLRRARISWCVFRDLFPLKQFLFLIPKFLLSPFPFRRHVELDRGASCRGRVCITSYRLVVMCYWLFRWQRFINTF
jgi:hypothetical protein